ncbi:MAG: glycosyltransferase [Muribaculaceae bacterium]|nr:glycosyltransferase [Muribaculaceae bacterium]
MIDHPLISIITITFNAANEIKPTMKSIASQTCHDFEHIIIDGASKDATIQVARSMGVPSLRILSEPDKGLYDAMNKGLRMSRGKYLLFLNAGDSFHDDGTLAAYAAAAVKNPDIIYADTVIVDKDRAVIGPRHLSAPDILTFQSFSKGMLVCHQAFMVKKSIAPLYDTSYRFSADYDWTVKCLQKSQPGNCINLHRIAIDYLSDGMTDKNKIASLKERFNIMCGHYGTSKTVVNHASFIARALKRRISGKN